MDWVLFWTAFGAIGTTTAAAVTAIAVVIAVKQYKQPLIKKLKISFSTSFPVLHNGSLGETLYHITVANCGVRPITISNIYFNIGGINLALKFQDYASHLHISVPNFPFQLTQEQSATFYIPYNLIAYDMKQILARQRISAHKKIRILVTDQTAGEHYFKTKLTAVEIARSVA